MSNEQCKGCGEIKTTLDGVHYVCVECEEYLSKVEESEFHKYDKWNNGEEMCQECKGEEMCEECQEKLTQLIRDQEVAGYDPSQ